MLDQIGVIVGMCPASGFFRNAGFSNLNMSCLLPPPIYYTKLSFLPVWIVTVKQLLTIPLYKI